MYIMNGIETVEVIFDGVKALVTITNRKLKKTALFDIDEYGVVHEMASNCKVSPKSIYKALLAYDKNKASVFA